MRAENAAYKDKRENVKDKLNLLGVQWYNYYTACNDDMQRTLQTEIFTIIVENEDIIVDGRWKRISDELFTDAVGDFYMNNLKQFDPCYNGEERSFFSFAKSRIGYRIQDCYDRNMGVKRHQVKEDGNVVTEKRKNISLDAVQEKFEKDGIGGSDWANIQSENTMKDPEELMEQDEKLLELTMLFTKITEHLTGRQNNENKQEYFRLFATENITGALKISEDTFFMKKRERDILSALKNDFLDYYMTEICRSMKKIHSCPMKKHCEVEVGSKDENEIEIPFSNKLYTAYFQRIQNRKVGDSAISMQRSSFKDLLSELYQVRS